MRIKLTVSRSAADGSQTPGDIIDLDAAEAVRLIDSGQAEPLPARAKKRTAANPPSRRKATT